MRAWVHLVILGAITAVMLRAPCVDLLTRRLLRIIGVYVVLSFVARAGGLLAFNPTPVKDFSFAMSNLRRPSYAAGLAEVLPVEWLFLLVMLLVAITVDRTRAPRTPRSTRRDVPLYLGVAFVAGAALSCLSVFPFAASISQPVAIGETLSLTVYGVVALRVDWRASPQGRYFVLYGLAWLVAYSFLVNSKTPILVGTALLYLDPQRRAPTFRSVALASTSFFVAFTAIQARATGGASSSGLPATLLESLSGRFDGLRALSVAVQRGPGSYMPLDDYAHQLVNGAVPSLLTGHDKVLSGRLWGIVVYRGDGTVSYAEGFVAEGYVMAGLVGVVVLAVVAGVLVVGLGRGATRRGSVIPWIAISLMASTALYERGLLGFAEHANISAQAVFALALLRAFFGDRGNGGRDLLPSPSSESAGVAERRATEGAAGSGVAASDGSQ
jgi:hypothetical protein